MNVTIGLVRGATFAAHSRTCRTVCHPNRLRSFAVVSTRYR